MAVQALKLDIDILNVKLSNALAIVSENNKKIRELTQKNDVLNVTAQHLQNNITEKEQALNNAFEEESSLIKVKKKITDWLITSPAKKKKAVCDFGGRILGVIHELETDIMEGAIKLEHNVCLFQDEIKEALRNFTPQRQQVCFICNLFKRHKEPETFTSISKYVMHLSCEHEFALTQSFRDELVRNHLTRNRTQALFPTNSKKVYNLINERFSTSSDWNLITLTDVTKEKLQDIRQLKKSGVIGSITDEEVIKTILRHILGHLLIDVKNSNIDNEADFLFHLDFSSYTS